MAWIESHQELARHPKTRRLARLAACSVPQAVGHLHLLWWWALDYAEDGDLSRYEPADVEDAMLWESEAGELYLALQQAGFIDAEHRIHDWRDYAGRLVEKREKNAERMREARAHRQHTPDPPVDPTPGPRAEHVQRTNGARAGATVQNTTVQNTTRPDPTPPAPSERPPTTKSGLRLVDREPIPKPKKAPNPVTLFLDAVKALDGELAVFGDRSVFHKRLTANPEADLPLLAEAYVSFRHGLWPGSRMLKDTSDPQWLLGDIGAYVLWKAKQTEPTLEAPPTPEPVPCPKCGGRVNEHGYGHVQRPKPDGAYGFDACELMWQAPGSWPKGRVAA